MSDSKPSRGDLTAIAALLLLALLVVVSLGGFMMVQQWREAQRRADVSHNLKQLRLSIQQYHSQSADKPVSEE